MKKQITILLLLLSSVTILGQWISFDGSNQKNKPSVNILSSDNSGFTVKISLTGMDVSSVEQGTEIFQSLKFPSYYTTLDLGKPQLPAIRELIGVPEFKNYNITIVDSSVTTLMDYNIFPFQKMVKENEKQVFTKDDAFYQKNTFYPENIFDLSTSRTWRDLRISRLSIFPVRYNPLLKVLKIYTNLVVKIEYKNSSGNAVVTNKEISDEWKNIYQKLVLNYDYIPVSSQQKLGKTRSITTTPPDYDYLIITADAYSDQVKTLAQWETRKGLLSKVVAISTVGNTESSIKNYILNEYNNHHISYVLLVGDNSSICLAQLSDGDLPYSLLAGGDYFPEIAIGRLPASSSDELTNMINKSIKYEINPPTDGNWLNKALLVAHYEQYPEYYENCSEIIRTTNYNNNPSFTTAYGSVGTSNSQVSSYINSGYGVVNYRGHGDTQSWYYWNAQQYYDIGVVNNLNNGNKTPVVFSIACSNATQNTPQECLAHAFVKNANGASAIFAATKITDYTTNHCLDQQLFVNAYNNNINRIGNISNTSMIYMINLYSDYPDRLETPQANAMLYVWFGDPALALRTSSPSSFTSATVTDNTTSISVSTGVSGCNIIACSMDNGVTYFSEMVNASSATFYTSVRPLYITITKPNYLPLAGISGGTISSNLTLSGDLKVLGNLQVNSGATLTISPGATLYFTNGTTLTVNGYSTLTANGTLSQPITFDFGSRNSSTQNGIIFNVNSMGTINYCKIRNAWRGIYENNWTINLSNSAFSNCYDGLYLYISSPTIQYCNFHDNANSGIYLIYSSPVLYNNYMQNNYYGVYCTTSSNPLFGNGTTHGLNGTSNYCGVYCYNNSLPVIGKTSPQTGGYNNLVNAAYNVYNASTGMVYANHIWWGDTQPANFKISGTTSYSDYLTSSVTISPPPPLNKINAGSESSGSNDIPMLANLNKAYQLMADNNLAEARAVCLDLVNNYPDYSVSYNALNLLKETYSKNELTSQKDLYNSFYIKKEKKDLYAMAGLILSDIDKDNKLKQINNVINNYAGSSVIELALFDKFIYYYFDQNDMANARATSDELDKQFALSAGANESHKILGDKEYLVNKPFEKQEKQTVTNKISDKYELYDNYPNPFNPSTNINYFIPEDGKVVVKVFDVLGRELTTLVNDIVSAGKHIVQWNGNNFASGIYFYSVTFKNQTLYKKMLLVK